MILITGAAGFLGQSVVTEALQQGYQVRAVVRAHPEKLPRFSHPNLTLIPLDLRNREGITDALKGVDGVIHLAATMRGDFPTQYAGTVTTTENLLQAMREAQVSRLIAISSFSVYDYLSLPVGATVDETTPLEPYPQSRDVYTQTKLIQEGKVREFAEQAQVTIVRPGMIYGKDHLWNAFLGVNFKDKIWLRIGNNAIIPLTYVENCAVAIIQAIKSSNSIGQTINIVDDELPTQQEYAQKILKNLKINPRIIYLDPSSVRSLGQFIVWGNQKLLQDRLKIPSLLVPSRFDARFKPLKYSNRQAKKILNWTPLYSLDEVLNNRI